MSCYLYFDMSTLQEFMNAHVPTNSIWFNNGTRWKALHVAGEYVMPVTCHKKPGTQEPAGRLGVKIKTLLNRYQRLS